jgi:serine/threonine-protein kinase
VPSLAEIAPVIPRSLTKVIERCLQKNPDDRWASGESLAEALESAAAPARAKLPMALRVWAQADDPLQPAYVAWYWLFTLQFLLVRKPGDFAWMVMYLLPLIPMSVFHARKTYKALSAGYGLRDLRTALAAWQAERREELAFETNVEEPRWARLLRRATYVLSISGAVVFRQILHVRNIREAVIIASLGAGAVLAFTASNALGVRLISPRIKSKLIGFARSALWNSRIGEWAAKLLTPRKKSGAAQLDYRPTEMALGLAVGDLYAALPKAYREHLSDLPAIVERLEAHAAAARARVDELSALASLGGGSSGASRNSTAERVNRTLESSRGQGPGSGAARISPLRAAAGGCAVCTAGSRI